MKHISKLKHKQNHKESSHSDLSQHLLNLTLKDQQYQILIDRLEKLQEQTNYYVEQSAMTVESFSQNKLIRNSYIKFPKTLFNAMKEVLDLSHSNKIALQQMKRTLNEK